MYRLSLKEWVVYGGQGIGACAAVSYVFYRSLVVFLLLLPVGFCYPLVMKKQLMKKRLDRLNVQFKEGISILASALRAGYSVENAFSVVAGELEQLYGKEAMITGEFDFLVRQVRMNCPVETVLGDFAARSGLEDVKNFSEIFSVAKRSGGELVSIIHHVVSVIRDKLAVREEILTLTAERRYEQRIMNKVPFLIVIYIDVTSPGFFDPMYDSLAGRGVMTLCLAVYLFAYWFSGRLLEIEV